MGNIEDRQVGYFNDSREEIGTGMCPDIFNLDTEQFQTLKKRIEEWNGVVRIFIHPGRNLYNPERKKIKDILFDLVTRPQDSVLPIIIFEEQSLVDSLSRGMSAGTEEGENKPYFIKTIDKYPFPVDDEYPDLNNHSGITGSLAVPSSPSFDRESDYLLKVMGKINRLFKDLGIIKILVGGNDLVYSEENSRFEQCVGNFIELIRQYGFEVDVSEATAPVSGRDYREIIRKRRSI